MVPWEYENNTTWERILVDSQIIDICNNDNVDTHSDIHELLHFWISYIQNTLSQHNCIVENASEISFQSYFHLTISIDMLSKNINYSTATYKSWTIRFYAFETFSFCVLMFSIYYSTFTHLHPPPRRKRKRRGQLEKREKGARKIVVKVRVKLFIS